ncbi:MAG: class B sortase [Clostridia bacterium]|nr:class B sortase [Clostridia bacterium]
MGKHTEENKDRFPAFFKHIYVSYIPNNRDNLKQILLKVIFIICLVAFIISAGYLANYFYEAQNQENIAEKSRELWAEVEEKEKNLTLEEIEIEIEKVSKALKDENPDYKAWIKISGTKIDYPIYQTDNNEYYLNHNQNRKRSAYGAIYFDYENKITKEKTDKNLVIYGHEMKNGSMFGELKKLKSLSFYKEHPTIDFSIFNKESSYKIYSIFILNADRNDDNGYIYNIYRQNFSGEKDFDAWVKEAYERSVINTNVDVKYGDNIITLVTCSNDFPNARLIVMAREIRENEQMDVDTSLATVNASPRYPQKWYDARGIKK